MKYLSFITGLLICMQPVWAARQPGHLITAATGIRVRSEAKLTSPVVTVLPIGEHLQMLAKSGHKTRIGKRNAYWYKVKTQDGEQGWIYGALAEFYDAANIRLKQRLILKNRFEVKRTIAEYRDIARWTKKLLKKEPPGDYKTELHYYLLLALHNAQLADMAGPGRASHKHYAALAKENKKYFYYDEISGTNLVLRTPVLDLIKEDPAPPVKEELTWLLVNLTRGGECEGEIFCELSLIRSGHAVYLEQYPQGKYSATAALSIKEDLERLLENHQTDTPPLLKNEEERERHRRDHAQLEQQLQALQKQLNAYRGTYKARIGHLINTLRRAGNIRYY